VISAAALAMVLAAPQLNCESLNALHAEALINAQRQITKALKVAKQGYPDVAKIYFDASLSNVALAGRIKKQMAQQCRELIANSMQEDNHAQTRLRTDQHAGR